MDEILPRAVLKPRKARPFYGRHPWVLESAIDRIEPAPADGDAVDLVSDKGKFVARGLYNSRSRIRIRLYTWRKTEPLDTAFWRRRLEAAVGLRKDLGYDDPAGAARLVFSEGDGLSGLVVDRYGPYLAVQVTALALATRLEQIVPSLIDLVQPRGIMIRTERGMTQAEGLELRDGPYWGEMPEGPVFIEEHGLRFGVDLAEGHKTGAYLDQRENRRAAAGLMRGRRVLDMFCYTGQFSIAASALGGAGSSRRGHQRKGRRDGQGQRRAERPGQLPLPAGRLLRGDAVANRRRRALRRRDPRPAQVRPQPFGTQGSDAGLPLAEPPGRATAGARGDAGHVQLLGPRDAGGLLRDAHRRGPADGPGDSGSPAAWGLA